MFAAVVLFVILLVAMLYLAFVRFRNPPQPTPAPSAVAAGMPLPRQRPLGMSGVVPGDRLGPFIRREGGADA